MSIATNRAQPQSPIRPGGLSPEQVWRVLGKASFAVISHVTPAGEPRSSGVLYVAIDHRIYVVTAEDSWKGRHIKPGGTVAVTVPVRRGGIMSLLTPIPPATISFHGTAAVFAADSHRAHGVLQRLGNLLPPDQRDNCRIIEISPRGRFQTYGIGIGLLQMRDPSRSQARVPVA